jgi:hypothetical protein
MKPTRDEMSQAVALLGPVIMEEVKAITAGHPDALTPANVDNLRERLRGSLASLVTDGKLPARDWPTLQVEHNAESRALGIHFGGDDNEPTEVRDRRIEGSAVGMWNMMRDAIADYHATKKPPPCNIISIGLSLYAAMVATGMDPAEAMAGAAWQAINHECTNSQRGAGAPKFTH